MPKFGLIGYPIAHSLSPALFREAFGERFGYDLIETPDFEEAWNIFLKDYRGINITAPFKEMAFARADSPSDVCRRIGACNIAVKSPEGIRAYNSDYLAVSGMLQKLEGDVAIIGFGGAGKAAAAAAADLGRTTSIFNRTKEKSQCIRPLDDIVGCIRRDDILIYTLPVPIPQLERLPEVRVIIEANYASPCLTGRAEQYISGTEWLRMQAECGFELLTTCLDSPI